MTEQTQTTAERVQEAVNPWEPVSFGAEAIAAEIDRITADNAQANQWLVSGVAKIAELEKQRDEARAEADRLRLPAEAWRTLEAARKEERTGTDENEHAEYWVHILARNAARAADRAREARK